MNHNHLHDYTRVSTTSTNPSEHSNGSLHQENSSTETLQQHPPKSSLSQSAASTVVTSTTAAASSTMNSHNIMPLRTMTERITDKVQAALWVIVASLVFHYTDSAHVLLLFPYPNENEYNGSSSPPPKTANVVLLQLVMIGLGMNTILFAYLLLYLPYVKGLHDSSAWEVYCPRVIPSMTLIGVRTFVVLIRATYPLWGFLAPFIISIEAMGVLFACHFIPVGFV